MLPSNRVKDLLEYVEPKYIPEFLGGDHSDDMSVLYARVDDDILRRKRRLSTAEDGRRSDAVRLEGEDADKTPRPTDNGGGLHADGLGPSPPGGPAAKPPAPDLKEDAFRTPTAAAEGDGDEEAMDPEVARALSTLEKMIQHVTQIDLLALDEADEGGRRLRFEDDGKPAPAENGGSAHHRNARDEDPDQTAPKPPPPDPEKKKKTGGDASKGGTCCSIQ